MSFLESLFYMAWRGLAIGIIISAPMGPVGMLIIQRTLDKGRRAGLYTGIGAAISDLFYALLTGLGLSFIEEFLERNQNIIQIVGSLVLVAFGIYLFKRNPSKGLKKPEELIISRRKSILGGFLFTFSNPLILFLIIGLFARFNFLLPSFSVAQYVTGYLFIFAGALIWWWVVTFSVEKVSHHFNIRSMWLINRIIGGMILLFAIVGIITATTAMANASVTRCWNAKRGLEPFGRMENPTADTLTVMTAAEGAEGLEFRCKARNRKPSKDWGFIIKSTDGKTVTIDIHTVETSFNGISTQPGLQIGIRGDGMEPTSTLHLDNTNIFKKIKSGMKGPDPTGGLNFYKISSLYGNLTLSGGLHTPEVLLSEQLPEGFSPDSIGFYLSPGALIEVEEARLSLTDFGGETTPWGDSEFLEEYLSHSRDRMEGYWQPLDRSLDETLLRLGGDYRLAIVKAGDGYDLIYLSGARINADNWEPGMVKAHLSPSGIKGVWDVTWHDAMHQPLSHELKAQRDDDGVLTIQFPYQASQIRLYTSGRE